MQGDGPMAETVLEEVGPNGNVQAVVESDDDVCFFYLCGAQETDFGMKAVWVRNHTRAPDSPDVRRMDAGEPPRNPAPYCRHPQGLPPPAKEDLRVVWLPEGNGAALYEGEEILAIIPPWSGTEDFWGYARDSIGEGPVAWALCPDNAILPRFLEAQSYWRKWDDEQLWPSIQSALLSRIESTFGRRSKYYGIDGGHWPPKTLVRIPQRDREVLITVGVSSRPQPNVEMHTERPDLLRRIELGVVLPARWPDDAVKSFGRYLSGQSDFPWSKYTWLGPGHTLPCGSWQNGEFKFALLVLEHAGAPRLSLGLQFDDPVNVLWFLPISAVERQAAIEGGSERLAGLLPSQRWEEA
jgi:hypothetical protein